MTASDDHIIKDFIESSGKQLFISAKLSEEKRWRELLLTLKYTSLIIDLKALKQHWKRNLNKYFIKDKIPKSPILESITFLTFLSNKEFSVLYKQIFKYEILRNESLSFDFLNCKPAFGIASVKEALHKYRVVKNPSLIVRVFEFFIAKIIKNIKSNIFDPKKVEDNGAEILIFYKHYHDGVLRCIKSNKFTHSLLLQLEANNNITEWVERLYIDEKVDKHVFFKLLNQMQKNGLINIARVR